MMSLEGFSELLHFVISGQHLLQPCLGKAKKSEPMDLASFLASINPSIGVEASLGEKVLYFIRTLQVCHPNGLLWSALQRGEI